MKKLTLKQKMFCEHYVKSGNATEAALKAGYKESFAKNRIHTMMKDVGICGYIEELNKEVKNARIADITEIKEFWSNIVRNENHKMPDRIKASELIAKTEGAFIDKVEVKGDIGVNPFSNLSTEELKKLIENER